MKNLFLILSVLSGAVFVSVIACGFSDSSVCTPLTDFSLYLGSGAIQAGLFSISMYFLWKGDLRATLASLGMPGTLKNAVIHSFAALIAIFFVLFLLGLTAFYAGFNDQQKVSDKIAGLPFIVLLFAALGAPVCEELFFRGLLTRRIGITFSAILFGLVHFAYGSTVEVAGAFLIGLVLGWTVRLTESLTPCILAHAAYNALAIAFMRLYG